MEARADYAPQSQRDRSFLRCVLYLRRGLVGKSDLVITPLLFPGAKRCACIRIWNSGAEDLLHLEVPVIINPTRQN